LSWISGLSNLHWQLKPKILSSVLGVHLYMFCFKVAKNRMCVSLRW